MSTRSFYSMTILFSLLTFVSVSFGQFTISIPKIPKIKKTVETTNTTTTTDTGQTNNTNNNSSNNNNSQPKSGECDQYSFVYGVFVDDIKKKQQEASEYDGPANKIYYVSATQDDYIRLAVSKSSRDKWFADKKMNDYRADKGCNKLDPALDELAAAVAKTIPLYVPEAGKYAVRNAAEEALMKSKINDLSADD